MNATAAKIVSLISVALLVACAAEPERSGELPTAPASFREAASAPAQPPAPAMPAEGAWWKIFGDPVLDDLVARADRRNWDVRLAQARLAQAKAASDAAEANRAPLLSAGASTSRKEGPLTNEAAATGTLYVGAVNLSYEVDLFGRIARQAEAATLDAGEREALLRSARLATRADVAQTYFALRAIDAERALLRDAAASQREAQRLMRGLVASGLSAELTATRMQVEAEAIEAEQRAVERRRAELEHALAMLIGEAPAQFQLAESSWTPVAPEIPAGIPAAALARRPDVAAAQQAMAAAQKRAGVARDSWLPSLSLTSAGGFASTALTTLLSGPSGAFGIAALIAMPLLDGGRHAAQVARADAEVDVSLARHGQQILVALKDVEDQLSALRTLRGQASALERAGEASMRTTRLVESNHRNGLASQLEIIDARRTELRTRRQALQAQAARVHATVGLVRALGGGWGGADDQARAP